MMTPNDQKQLEQALKLHESGSLEGALKTYQTLISIYPQHADILHLIGIILAQQNHHDKAHHLITQALELDPNSSTYHNSMANILKQQGKLEDAQHHYHASLEKKPFNPAAYNNLGVLNDQLEDYNCALSFYTQALNQKPDYAEAHFNCAMVLLKLNRLEKAEESLNMCVQYDPQYAKAHNQLGQIKQNRHDLTAAIRHYQTALSYFPEDAATHHRLATALIGTDDVDEAIDHFKITLRIQPKHPETLHNLATLYYRRRDLGRALSFWLKLLEMDSSEDTYYNIACVYADKNYHHDALHYFQRTIDINPDHIQSFINMAAIHLKDNQTDQALLYYDRVLELDPVNHSVQYIVDAIRGSHCKYDCAPASYVTDLFDQYATHYDEHLLRHLEYKGHKLLFNITKSSLESFACGQLPLKHVLDIGCGTGLCGPLFKPYAQCLTGIDLSQNMVVQAENTSCYTEVMFGDVLQIMPGITPANCIIAADMLPYLGSLENLFSMIASCLQPHGLFAFTTEYIVGNMEDYILQSSARFAHSESYLAKLSQQYAFSVLSQERHVIRSNQGKAIHGLVTLLQK